MNSFLQQLRAFFENLAPRERLLVSAVGALLLLTLLWFGVVQRAIAFADSVEERVAMSPDALTGMEASLRFPGPETMESRIFARLSAWQNWIFIRPNATGEMGALTNYGTPTQPEFDFRS